MLLGVLRRSEIVGVALGLRAVQRTELGVDVEQPVLTGQQVGVAPVGDLGEPALHREQAAQRRRRQVVAEQVVAEWLVDAVARLARRVDASFEARQLHPGHVVARRCRDPVDP